MYPLRSLAESPFGGDVTSKDGTSLTKANNALSRFSEDLDVTCDIRAIDPDLVEGAGEDALPRSSSQERNWSGKSHDV